MNTSQQLDRQKMIERLYPDCRVTIYDCGCIRLFEYLLDGPQRLKVIAQDSCPEHIRLSRAIEKGEKLRLRWIKIHEKKQIS